MMSRRALYVLLMMVVGGLSACDTSEQFGTLTAPVTPQFAKNGNKETQRIVKWARLASATEACVDKIGKNGGSVTFDGGSLEVTRNAVQTPTTFCVKNIGENGEIKLQLRAYQQGNEAPVTQFRAIVRLTVDLTGADVTDWNSLKIVWHNYDAHSLDNMPTAANKDGKTVTANLTHFSDYSVTEKGDPAPGE
ncbi:MAG TPA: hypothetical protein VM100_06730 [Longimicrobiales bacterium]|nr:hypothetical protein [Longimicrobiales bacterium]